MSWQDHLTPEEQAELDALLEAERVDNRWALQDRQQRAEDFTKGIPEDVAFELLYGGAAGGGKSEWLLWHVYHLALKYPGFKALLLRRTFPELERSLILRSMERFDPAEATYNDSKHVWRFRNGSRIEFGYLERDKDVHAYQSAEYDVVGWDELTNFPTSYPYLYLLSRIRTRYELSRMGLRPHVVAGTNPGGVGGHWVKERWIDVSPPEEITVHEVEVAGEIYEGLRVFVPAKLTDNRYINARAYIAGLAQMGVNEPALLAQLLDGSWDAIEGQFFPEWRRDVHVIRPFTIPSFWHRIGGIDYGYAAPFAALSAAIDGDGNLYVYREHYETKLTPPQQAALILKGQTPGEKVDYRVADPSMFANTGVGLPIAAQYRGAGVPVRRAMNDRPAGWARLREYLRLDPVTGKPRLFVFSSCRNLIRTLPMLVYDDKKPEDCNTDGEDHAPDALRYLVMSRPAPSHAPKPAPATLEERLAARRRSRERERRRGADHPMLGRGG